MQPSFFSNIKYTNNCCKSFIENSLYLPSFSGRSEYVQIQTSKIIRESVAANAEPVNRLNDIIKLIALIVLFPLTLIALLVRNINRADMKLAGSDTPATIVFPVDARPLPNAPPTTQTIPSITRNTILNPTPLEHSEEEYLNFLLANEIHELIPNLYLSGAHKDGYTGGMVKLDGTRFGDQTTIHQFAAAIRTTSINDDSFKFSTVENPASDVMLHGGLRTQRVTKDDFTFLNLKNAALIGLSALSKNRSVLINCAQGCDRSPAVAAIFIALIYDTTIREAATYNKSIRAIADPFAMEYGHTCVGILPALKEDPEIKTLVEEIRAQRGIVI